MTDFRPVPRIETQRLVLACWGPGDAVALDEALVESRDHLLPWMPWALAEPTPIEAKLELLCDWRDAFREARDFHYAILERGSGRLLGAIGAHPRVGPGALELGYWVRASEVGRGVATEAVAGLARVALELMGAHRIEVRMDARNEASARVPRRLGLRLEGRLREDHLDAHGARSDRLIFALLARELPGSPLMDGSVRALDWSGGILLQDGFAE